MLRIIYKSGFLIFLAMAFVLQRPETLFFGGVMCAVYAFSSASFLHVKWNEFLFVLIIAGGCSLAIFRFNHGLSPVFYLFSTLSTFYAARHFNESSINEVSRCLRVVFWVAIFAIGYILVRYWGYPEPFGEVIPGSSTNGIPSYLVVLQIALSLAVFLEKGKLPLWSPIFTLMVAVLGVGRGSIVVASMILFFSILFNFLLKEMTIIARAAAITIGILIVFFISLVLSYLDGGVFFDGLIYQSKFSEGLLDPYRGQILDEYLDKLDLSSFLFGSDYSGTVISSRYEGNPHISYIRTHAFFGFLGLVFVFSSPLLIMAANKKSRHKVVFLCFVLFALMRALSEPIFFPTLLDFFYFLYFFMFFKYAPIKNSKKNLEV